MTFAHSAGKMTASDGQQRRNGTGVFIPACMLQDSGVPEGLDESQACPAERIIERHCLGSRRSLETSAKSSRNLSCTRGISAIAPGSAQQQPGPPPPPPPPPPPVSDDTMARKMYQQSALYSPSPAGTAGPTAPRAPASTGSANAANRTSRRCSIDSSVTSRRTARRYSVDSSSLQQWAGTRSTNSTTANSSPSTATAPSALYAPTCSTSPATMRTAPRLPAGVNAGMNGSAARRMSVDLHNMRAAGIGLNCALSQGAEEAAAAGGGGLVMPCSQGCNAAQSTPAGRCSFDVGSCIIGCFSSRNATSMPPPPAAAAPGATYILQNGPVLAAGNGSCMLNSQGVCYDRVQLQQQDSMMRHRGISHLMTPSPSTSAEQALDDQIHTALMDILDLGSQLAAAADTAGAGAAHTSPHGRYSMEQQPALIPFYNAEITTMLSPEVNTATLQQHALAPELQMGPCSLAPIPAAMGTAASTRNSVDMLLLPHQPQQVVAAAVAAQQHDAAGIRETAMTSTTVGAAFPVLELDAIDESAADATAYFINHTPLYKGEYDECISTVGGNRSPILFDCSSSPQTTAAAGPRCGDQAGFILAGMCDQAGEKLSGVAPSWSPEAQAKLQELMAAQQLQLEIQNELLTMLAST